MASGEQSIGQAKGRSRSARAAALESRGAGGIVQPKGQGNRGDPLARFSKRYLMGLQNYLLHPEEVFLQLAYELGRQAVAEGIGILNLFRIHASAAHRLTPEHPEKVMTAEAFFMEAISPFEATHRGFRETNARLSELNATLAKRNNELAAINFELNREIEERKRTEEALRQSKEHYRVLFNDARVMQENLRHLSNRVLCVQEEERKRISRELHDEVGQALTAVNVHLAMARKTPQAAAEQIAEAQKLVEQTMAAVHQFARELRPAMLDDLGLAAALRSHIQSFTERTKLVVTFETDPVVDHLGDDEKMVVYRVTQEALTNVVRHAEATHVTVTIRQTRVAVRLEISDNGKAFSSVQNENSQKRLGVLGMQERVRLVNGTFHIDSSQGKGTTIRVDLPLPREAPGGRRIPAEPPQKKDLP
ncbi:MAG TPA: histidine kinase [Verrucomicrobiae bacterium]|nr:histidine kinase [Verrucomicrobiae bacterium]